MCGGGCVCVEEDTCVWRRIRVCGGGDLCVEEDTCVCVDVDACVWRRIRVVSKYTVAKILM